MSDSESPKVGVIGGSGLYTIDQIENVKEIEINTHMAKHLKKYYKAQFLDRCFFLSKTWQTSLFLTN